MKNISSDNINGSNKKKFFGLIFFLLSVFLGISFATYFCFWEEDQNIATSLHNAPVKNWAGPLGAKTAHLFIFKGFGIASLIIPILLFFWGLKWIFTYSFLGRIIFFFPFNFFLKGPVYKLKRINIKKCIAHSIFWIGWISVMCGWITYRMEGGENLSGELGFNLFDWLKDRVYEIPTVSLIFGILLVYLFLFENAISEIIQKTRKILPKFNKTAITHLEDEKRNLEVNVKEDEENNIEKNLEADIIIKEEKVESSMENYNPKLDLPMFKAFSYKILNDYGESNVRIDKEELDENSKTIRDTLNKFNITVENVEATVGPTITLYEMTPGEGVRISKIKNLEDDIALNLSALGIRIIAPIPGRGTIGIEVPNKKKRVVSLHKILFSNEAEKFCELIDEKGNKQGYEGLPIVLGRTIDDKPFIADLSTMPHLLMAGATGQGKSVGINTILTSLLHKKHPAEIKFVLIDPKKVELSIYSNIENHYLAKLPDSNDPIITDTSKVVNTLKSLCQEMDNRYEMLKQAHARNIKDYNKKFTTRKLNPIKEFNGLKHNYLPYIVLVIDEFADLIMTAGKEVETPISRLAQLARAVGIHLIIATQRPSVNVITGLIKANFPTRIAFRVTSKIDSRTILDISGAEQLIGMGDMLYSSGSDLKRIQCAFTDTPDVEKVVEHIQGQKSYLNAMALPKVQEEKSNNNTGTNSEEKDSLFEEAAKIIVSHNQGSASLLQRKLKIGYNRAGRLIDQLEREGIIGEFRGSKPREVLISDIISLEELLNTKI